MTYTYISPTMSPAVLTNLRGGGAACATTKLSTKAMNPSASMSFGARSRLYSLMNGSCGLSVLAMSTRGMTTGFYNKFISV